MTRRPPVDRPKQPARRSGHLTAEEQALWHHVAGSVAPLKSTRRPQVSRDDEAETAAPAAPTQKQLVLPTTPAEPSRYRPLPSIPTPRPQKVAPPPQTFDKKKARRLADGRTEIEARIDLHGLREAEAHSRLRGFLRQAHANGLRAVLVITGKGRANDDDHAYAPFDLGAENRSRGVLKRNVPRWLAEPDLAVIVVSYTTAHVRHGGEGAIYVHLRRHR
jgi:DNA-nicking Smr family endonuclease